MAPDPTRLGRLASDVYAHTLKHPTLTSSVVNLDWCRSRTEQSSTGVTGMLKTKRMCECEFFGLIDLIDFDFV